MDAPVTTKFAENSVVNDEPPSLSTPINPSTQPVKSNNGIRNIAARIRPA